jgi:hypothetical protein
MMWCSWPSTDCPFPTLWSFDRIVRCYLTIAWKIFEGKESKYRKEDKGKMSKDLEESLPEAAHVILVA